MRLVKRMVRRVPRDTRMAVRLSQRWQPVVYCLLHGLWIEAVAILRLASHHLKVADGVHLRAYVVAAMPRGFCDQQGMSQLGWKATVVQGCWRRHPLGGWQTVMYAKIEKR